MHAFYYFFMRLSDHSLTALFPSHVDGPVLTYRQFAGLVATLHRFFREKGVRPGHRILTIYVVL